MVGLIDKDHLTWFRVSEFFGAEFYEGLRARSETDVDRPIEARLLQVARGIRAPVPRRADQIQRRTARELVQVVPGPSGEQLVAYLKRPIGGGAP